MVSYNVTLLSKQNSILNIHEFTGEGGTFADLLCITEDVRRSQQNLNVNPLYHHMPNLRLNQNLS